MKVLDEARDFYVYTMRILKKVPKSDRWLGAYEVQRLMDRFHSDIFLANNTEVKNRLEADQRHAYQAEAVAIMKTVAEKFDAFMDVMYGMNYDGLETWTRTMEVIKAKIIAWQKSDEERYKDL